MEKLIKSMLGQWSLVEEAMGTPTRKDMFTLQKTDNVPVNKESNGVNEKLSESFKSLDTHHTNQNDEAARAAKGDIKHFAMAAPKGSLDLGHLSRLYMEHRSKREDLVGQGGNEWDNRFGSTDLREVMNHHAGGTKSLKAFHKKHGDDGLKGLMHTMGSNGGPMEYTGIHMHPSVHSDLLDLIEPGAGKSNKDRKENRHKGVLPKSPFHNTEIDRKHYDDVNSTYSAAWDHANDWYAHDLDTKEKVKAMHAHDEAVQDRGMAIFKKRYKIE